MSTGRKGFTGHVLTVAVFWGVFFVWVGFILYKSGALPTRGTTYTLEAEVPTASLLTPGARVTIAGAAVGKVKNVERAAGTGPGSTLTLELTDDRVVPLPRDSRLQIRTRTQVGENYVSIVVGRDRENIPDGGSVEQADELVDVDRILSVLSGKSKKRTEALLTEFGDALAGRGDELNRTLRDVSPTVDYGSRLVDVLHGERKTVATLIDQLGRVMSTVGDRGASIDIIASRGLESLRSIGDRDATLAATIRELPSTLDQVRHATHTIGDVSDAATPVVTDLAAATRELRPAVRHLAPAARDGRAVVAGLARANPELDRLLRNATRATRDLPGALPAVQGAFCQLNPALRFLEPYKDDVLQSVFHLGSAANAYDATGHLIRLMPIINENSLGAAPPEVLAASRVLLQSGAFVKQKVINYHPYMKPGEIGKSKAKGNQPSGPQALKASGYKYPRVEADC